MEDAILIEILTARRLLSDHVDILAVTLDQLRATKGEAPRNTGPHWQRTIVASGVSLVAVCSWKSSRVLKLVPFALALGWSGYVTLTWCQMLRSRGQMTQLRRFIANLSAFDVVNRRNLKVIRESGRLIEDPSRAYNEKSMHMRSIQSEIVIIRAFVEAVHTLEQAPLPYEMLEVYQNLESLDDCDLFQRHFASLEPQHLKDFHQIFQYVQSQLLTRFALAVVHNPEVAQKFMRSKLPQLFQLLAVQLRLDADVQQSLTVSEEIQSRLNLRRSNHTTVMPFDPTISQLQGLSLDVLARFLAIATKMRHLNEIIQSETNLTSDTIRNQHMPIEQIDVALGACADDFRRLVLTYNRLIHGSTNKSEPVAAIYDSVTLEDNELEPQNFSESLLNREPESEFYALLDSDSNDDEKDEQDSSATKRSNQDAELVAIDERVVKRHFKPVLLQLKDRLEPINMAMRDRERKFLESKGFNEEIEQESQSNGRPDTGSDSDNDELDSIGRLRKKTKTVDNYGEMRRFLEAKQQISLISMHGTLPPPRRMIEEDILE